MFLFLTSCNCLSSFPYPSILIPYGGLDVRGVLTSLDSDPVHRFDAYIEFTLISIRFMDCQHKQLDPSQEAHGSSCSTGYVHG